MTGSGMIADMAQKDTRTYADRQARNQDSEEYRRMPRRAIPAPAELWEAVDAEALQGAGELTDRERGRRVNAYVRKTLADAVGRPDLANTDE